MPLEQLKIVTEKIDSKKVTIVRLSGQLDAHTFEDLQETLANLFDKDIYRIIIDMSDIHYMSSAGAGTLVGALSATQQNDGNLVIMGVSPTVLQVLKVLGLTDVFKPVADQTTALALFSD